MKWRDDCEQWVGKDLEEDSHGLFRGVICLERQDMITSVRVTCNQAEPLAGFLWKTNIGCYCCAKWPCFRKILWLRDSLQGFRFYSVTYTVIKLTIGKPAYCPILCYCLSFTICYLHLDHFHTYFSHFFVSVDWVNSNDGGNISLHNMEAFFTQKCPESNRRLLHILQLYVNKQVTSKFTVNQNLDLCLCQLWTW
jgi:hypothetical protein